MKKIEMICWIIFQVDTYFNGFEVCIVEMQQNNFLRLMEVIK